MSPRHGTESFAATTQNVAWGHTHNTRTPAVNETISLVGWHSHSRNLEVDFWTHVVGLHPKGLQEDL